MKLLNRFLFVVSSVVVLFFLYFFIYDLSTIYSLVDALISTLLFFALSAGFEYTARHIKLSVGELLKFITVNVAAALVISFIWLQTSSFLIERVVEKFDPGFSFLDSSYAERFFIVSLLNLLVISYNYLLTYYESYKQKLNEETQLKNLVAEAEIKTLKFQINPHFIFNSLNSIAALTSLDPEKAREMVIKLADFLRYTLSTNNRQMNKLRDEISNIEKYLSIEKVRFGDKFIYEFQVPSELLDLMVPNMLLQPVFENAIKYGVYENLGQTLIKTLAIAEDSALNLTIENTLEEEPKMKIRGEGVGLQNISERLRLIYNQPNLIRIEKESNLFRVVIKIPFGN